MRRHVLPLLILVLGSIVLLAAPGAEGEDGGDAPAPSDPQPILVKPDPDAPPIFGPLTGIWQEPLEVEVEVEQVPDPRLVEDHGSDSCSLAPTLAMTTFGSTAGDNIAVNNMTVDSNDPILSCQWGTPSNPRGWRTVWYRFVAPVSGRLAVETSFNASNFDDSYDTVLALFQSGDGTCGTLTMLSCNDDTNGFFSAVNAFVIEGRTYYIEVADRSFGVQGPATLRLSVVLEEGSSLWQRFGAPEYSEPAARSRHAIVSDGRYIYLISGERITHEGFPEQVGRLDRFDTQTRTWLGWPPLKPIPREYYSRTSAVLLGGHIYVPSGYTGNNQAYDGTHFIYNLAINEWVEGVPVPWAQASASGEPYAWHQAVAAPAYNGYFVTGGLLEGDPNQLFPPVSIVPTDSMLFYDARQGEWRTDRTPMDTARFAHVAGRLNNNEICVAGGLTRLDADPDDLAAVVSSTECYNIVTNQWSQRASMNIPRFSAGSAVGPDGRWYVFGGVNSQLSPVTLTEVYNPATNSWTVLDSRYSVRNPARAWVRGAFANNGLWIFGGEEVEGNEVIPVVERLSAPGGDGPFVPVYFNTGAAPTEPNDTLAQAMPIALGQEVRHTFDNFDDYFDFFTFNVSVRRRYAAYLSDIPAERDYNVYIYNRDKLMVGHSTNIGQSPEEAVSFELDPGRYYVLVMRAFGEPFGSPYRLVVRPYEPPTP